MSDAVYDELGMKPKQIGAYFKCPSDDLAGLGADDDILAQAQQLSQEPLMMLATNTAPMEERTAPDISSPAPTPSSSDMSASTQNLLNTLQTTPSGTFDPFALQKMASSGYTYHTPPGQFVGPIENTTPTPAMQAAALQSAGIAAGTAAGPFAQAAVLTAGGPGTIAVPSNSKMAADAIAALMKGATPAAQAYIQLQAAQAMARNQPIHVPIPYAQQSRGGSSSLLPWLIGGGLVAALLLGWAVTRK
jgi:hypothetical protein